MIGHLSERNAAGSEYLSEKRHIQAVIAECIGKMELMRIDFFTVPFAD